jgi:hypothetical protein
MLRTPPAHGDNDGDSTQPWLIEALRPNIVRFQTLGDTDRQYDDVIEVDTAVCSPPTDESFWPWDWLRRTGIDVCRLSPSSSSPSTVCDSRHCSLSVSASLLLSSSSLTAFVTRSSAAEIALASTSPAHEKTRCCLARWNLGPVPADGGGVATRSGDDTCTADADNDDPKTILSAIFCDVRDVLDSASDWRPNDGDFEPRPFGQLRPRKGNRRSMGDRMRFGGCCFFCSSFSQLRDCPHFENDSFVATDIRWRVDLASTVPVWPLPLLSSAWPVADVLPTSFFGRSIAAVFADCSGGGRREQTGNASDAAGGPAGAAAQWAARLLVDGALLIVDGVRPGVSLLRKQ